MQHVHCIYIANEEATFFNRLDERLTSRLQTGLAIRLSRYSTDELAAIYRANVGLDTGAAPTAALREFAQLASDDSRVAIGVLYEAAVKAPNLGHVNYLVVHEEHSVRRGYYQFALTLMFQMSCRSNTGVSFCAAIPLMWYS